MYKKTFLASLLAALSVSATAADYYLVVPAPGKEKVLEDIQVVLNAVTLPAGTKGEEYAYDLNAALVVTGDPRFTSTGVSWAVASGALPAGLMLEATGDISGAPTEFWGTQMLGIKHQRATWFGRSRTGPYPCARHG